MWEDNLKNRMEDVCPHCGNHSEEVVEYCKDHDKVDPVALYKEAIALNGYVAGNLINLLLSGDYEIFTPWYKALLKYISENGEPTPKWRAADILSYYREDFDEVPDLEIEQEN